MNYKSFGFTKIVPRLSQEKFAAVIEKSANAANAIPLWDEVGVQYRSQPNFVIKHRDLVERAHLRTGTRVSALYWQTSARSRLKLLPRRAHYR